MVFKGASRRACFQPSSLAWVAIALKKSFSANRIAIGLFKITSRLEVLKTALCHWQSVRFNGSGLDSLHKNKLFRPADLR